MECKVNLEFDLPEQELDCNLAIKGLDLALFILDIRNDIRDKYKHSEDGKEVEKWGDFQDYFRDKLTDSGLLDLIESIY